jgi:hypothetical protein
VVHGEPECEADAGDPRGLHGQHVRQEHLVGRSGTSARNAGMSCASSPASRRTCMVQIPAPSASTKATPG